ncbi:hypothetical protein G6F56_004166 [Rhizopus delemar]|uniref:Uncharacterized protein n=1 Tax=Rhizopus stolonifer TaxID=4846 RepID=A0A367KHI2_RHIST|nr:hypothetical protein G6F56_004166 [Rhizopus delemar]RCI01684.1 hypothetical protein CU098_005898 [Rhizopus stolonifer]
MQHEQDESKPSFKLVEAKMKRNLDDLYAIKDLLMGKTKNQPNKQVQQLELERSNHEIEVNEYKSKLQEANEKLKAMQTKVDQLQKIQEDSKRQQVNYVSWRMEMDATRAENQALGSSVQELTESLKEENGKISQLESLLRTREQELKEARQETFEKTHELNEARQETLEREQELNGAKQETLETKQELNETRLIILEREKELDEARQEILIKEQELKKCQKTKAYLEEILEEKEKDLENYVTENLSGMEILKDKIEKLQEENTTLEKKYNDLDASKTTKSKSRIPKRSLSISTRNSEGMEDLSQKMKNDLLLYQEKLAEMTAQNRDLIKALDRSKEYTELLKKNLRDTREESDERYRRLLIYREEKQTK